MEFPNALFLLETDLPILPKHVLGRSSRTSSESHAHMFESPLGSGPFKAVKNLSDQSLGDRRQSGLLSRQAEAGQGSIFRIVKQADAAQIALERGEVDFTAAPPEMIRDPGCAEPPARPASAVHAPHAQPVSHRSASTCAWTTGRTSGSVRPLRTRSIASDHRQSAGWQRRNVNSPIRHPMDQLQAQERLRLQPGQRPSNS